MKILKDFIMTHTDVKGSTSLLIHLNCGCNLKCYKCYNYRDLVQNSSRLDWVDVCKLFEYLHRDASMYDAVIISGGEPTLCNDELINLSKQLQQFNLKVILNTNGTKPEILKILIYEKLIDKFYVDMKFPFFKNTFNNYNLIWEQIYGIPFNVKLQKRIYESFKLLYKSSADFELRTVRYPFLEQRFLNKYKGSVRTLNAMYDREINHQFNDFYEESRGVI